MAEESEVIQHEMDETRHALAEKLGQLSGKVSDTVDTVEETVEDVTETAQDVVKNVKDTFNLPKQTRKHPWLVVGGAVVAGYVGGRIVEGIGARRRSNETHQYAAPAYNGQAAETTAAPKPVTAQPNEDSSGWLSGITQTFGPQMNTLKGLAVGALFGVVRDMITQSLPDALKGEVGGVFNDAAERAGGKAIKGNLIDDDKPEEEHVVSQEKS